MARYTLELSEQAQAWLDEEQDRDLVRTVARWIRDVLLDDDSEIESAPVPTPRGHLFHATGVPETDVSVIWFEAAPFRTIKIMWIEHRGPRLRGVLEH